MPFVQSISLRSSALIAALGVALAALATPIAARAGSLGDARAIGQAPVIVGYAPVTLTPFALHATSRLDMATDPQFAVGSSTAVPAAVANHEQQPPQAPDTSIAAIDDTPVADAAALDDQVLARQRGTGLGLMTIAASAQPLRGAHAVTLWDEIAPPAPAPVPADTTHVAQSNAVTYFRK